MKIWHLRAKYIRVGRFRIHRYVAGAAAVVILFTLYGIWAARQPPTCRGITVLSGTEVDAKLADRGYLVLSHLRGKRGCHYRVATTPEGLRAVILYDANTERIVVSKWDYLEEAEGKPVATNR